MPASSFIADFFSASAGSIYLCSLPNERNGGQVAELCGRGGGVRLDDLVHQWDRKDRGTFFCVSTLVPKQSKRCKDTVFEITCLHADIDFAKIDVSPEVAERRLGELLRLPSKVVHSGHGLHAYWLFSEALPATPELITRVEKLLRQLADHIGGDPAVAECSRLMRLPFSHNTKNGDRLPVRILVDRPLRYELNDLEEWLSEARPLISRKGAAPATDNPFLAVNMPGGGGAPVDIGVRLAAMQYQGEGDTSIHQTQVSVTAAMLNRGVPTNEVVRTVLDATRKAAGAAGERWDWQREERDILAMCASWARKKLNGQQSPQDNTTVTMEALSMAEFKAVEFLVPGLIPAEGVTLICSKPKAGKSWFLFDLCISTAMQRVILDGRQPARGHTLYLALEDNLRRLRSRGEKLLLGHPGPWPANMSVATSWPRVDQGGLERIREWALAVQAKDGTVACIAIDVLKMIRPAGQEKKTVYDRDYESLVGLRALSHELGTAFVVSHHVRKTAADDPQDTISGTLGLSASADCNIVLEHQSDGSYVLDVKGRDVEHAQFAAVFDKGTCRWTIAGDAAETRRSETKRAILAALADAPDGMTPQEVADATDLVSSSVRSALLRMRRAGEVTKAGSRYRAP
jgi:hypothetical protein